MAAVDLSASWLDPSQIAIDPTKTSGWHEFLVRVAAVIGAAPYTLVRTLSAPDDFDVAAMLPCGLTISGDSTSDSGRQFLVTGTDAVVTLLTHGRHLELYAAATTAARRDELDEFYGQRCPADQPDPQQVRVQFVYSDQGLARVPRWIRARSWSESRCYYPAAAAALLDQVVAVRPEPSGRVVLLHGPPGTGKTTALLALAREWRDWCRFSFVLDPDALFCGNPGYVLQLALDASQEHWQMLVIEDAADLLRPTDSDGMHPGLARLLNLTDGALGQGLRLMVCITTNESLSTVHRALRRPGRCLANIHIGELTVAEANALLPGCRPVDRAVTLAEVLERRGDLSTVKEDEDRAPVGAYL